MKRVSAHASGRWVCTPKDFLDLGSREAVGPAAPGRPRPLRHTQDQQRAEATRAGRSGCRHRSAGEAGQCQDHAGWSGCSESAGSHERGPREGQLRDGRPLEDRQDRRTNGPVPTRRSERHAMGGATCSPGDSGAAVARSRRRRGRAGPFDFESSPSR